MDNTTETTANANDATGQPTTQAPENASLNRERIKDGMLTTGQAIWGLVGMLATLGGVLGLFQFFSSLDDRPSANADTLLVAMVAEGVISEEQATNLTNALTGSADGLEPDEESTLKSAVENLDKDAIVAMANMLNKETYTEGLRLLEASAESADDWLELAKLAWGRDIELCLRAAERAVVLNPDSFRAVTLLVQAQAAAGNYKQAVRSAETARIIASTPAERLQAESAITNVYVMGRDVDNVEISLEGLQAEIEAFSSVAQSAGFSQSLTGATIYDHPVHLIANALSGQAYALTVLQNYDQALGAISTSNEWYERLRPHVTDNVLIEVQKAEIRNRKMLAGVYVKQEDKENAYLVFEDVISMWQELTAMGDASARESLAVEWSGYGQAAYKFGDKDKALILYENGRSIISEFADENPESEEWQNAVEYYNDLILFLVSEDNPGEYKARLEDKFKKLRQDLIMSPEDLGLKKEFLNHSTLYSGILRRDVEANAESLNTLVSFVDETAAELRSVLGGNYYSIMLEYHAEYVRALVDEENEDVDAAKAHYNNMLDIYDLLISAPDIDSYDPEKLGTEIYGFKLGTLYKLALFKDDDALRAAKSGLSISEGLNKSGQLRTGDQYYLKQFGDLVSELDAKDSSAQK